METEIIDENLSLAAEMGIRAVLCFKLSVMVSFNHQLDII